MNNKNMVRTSNVILWLTGGLIALGVLSAKASANPDCPDCPEPPPCDECPDCPDCPTCPTCPTCPEPEPCPPQTGCPITILNTVQKVKFYPIYLWEPRMHLVRASLINTSQNTQSFWTETFVTGNNSQKILSKCDMTKLQYLQSGQQYLYDVVSQGCRFSVPPEDDKIIVELFIYDKQGREIGYEKETLQLYN